ncbi:helicase associated domain-containing protein [Streptomyces sp. NPDC006539]|uniref:helicase associated domain-containing protein n=1 Tax=Streptomyces TaxID=1883 RepID=UPI00339565D2
MPLKQPPGTGRPAARSGDRGPAATRAFHHRDGHLYVPQRHIEVLDGGPVRLGRWISNARRRKERLAADRVHALDALSMRW